MTTLILSAGVGSRLGDLTRDVPKPMIEVGGKPVLEHLVDHVRKYSQDSIMVNVHYKAEKIMDYFGDKLIYIHEPILLGDIMSTKRIKELINGDLLVMNADTLTNINIANLRWESEKSSASIASFEGMTYTGTTYYNEYYPNKIILKEYGCYWQDIGTPEGLEKARRDYATSLQQVSI